MSFSDLKSSAQASGTPGSGAPRRDDRAMPFGRYRLFPDLRLLLRDGARVDLGARAFDVLRALIEAEGRLVTKDELMRVVWAGAVVEENSLQAQISSIRRALGPDRDLVSTEFGRGYRLAAAGDAAAAAKASPAPAGPEAHEPPPALPNPVTSLIGRADELDEVERLVRGVRLVTITGPGGIGKTRLAIELGQVLRPFFSGEVYLADMARAGDAEAVWSGLATCLRAPRVATGLPADIQSSLRDRRMLLIVDGCEHLAEPIAAAAEALLRNAPALHVVATSQQPLDAEGETLYRLAPLAVPSVAPLRAADALAHGAVQLFVERARANSRAFAFDDGAADGVAAICRHLDGMPLALELAAARVSSLGVDGVLDGLADRFKLLTAGRPTALPRHRTLRATIDWSHALLGEEERELFRRLSAFPASFTAEAARSVAAPEHGDPGRTTELLSDLVAKSLLQSDLSAAVPRFRLLDSVRVYAREKLADDGEVDAVARRHAAFFAGVVDRAWIDWKGVPTGAWRARYEATIDDLREALDWAFSEGGDRSVGLDMLAASAPFWIQLSMYGEGRRRISAALDEAVCAPAIDPRQEMALQAALGTSLTWARGPVDETRSAWSRALDLAVAFSDSEIQLQSHYGLWLYHLRTGGYEASLGQAGRMIAVAEGAGDGEARAAGRRMSGVSHHFMGEHAEGRRLIEDALRWYDSGRPVQSFRFGLDQRVAGLAFLARILWVQGLSPAAVETAAAAVEAARAIDHACSLCCALAEGWCIVGALDGDRDAVAGATAALSRTAERHGLGFWKAYADLFGLWASARREGVTPGRLEAVMETVKASRFDLGYTTLLADLLVALAASARADDAFPRLTAEILAEAGSDAHWGGPEFRRVRALLAKWPDRGRADLAKALALAERQGALAWQRRIGRDLAEAAGVAGPSAEV